jgi:hypothetical protein
MAIILDYNHTRYDCWIVRIGYSSLAAGHYAMSDGCIWFRRYASNHFRGNHRLRIIFPRSAPFLWIIPSTDIPAFGWLTIAGSIGVMSGAGLSGYLAEPAGRVPVFGDIELFKQKPYLLPGMTISLVALLAALAVFFTVPEVR